MQPIDSVFLLFCVYVPILIVIYVVQLWMIIKPSSIFRGSFYWLYVASGVVDLIFIIFSFPEFRVAIYPLVNGGGMVANGFAHLRMFLSYACPIAQDWLNLFIAFNRLTAISMPMRSNEIWSKYRLLPISVVFSILFSVVFLIPYAFRLIYYAQVPMGNYIIYLAISANSGFADWYNAQAFSVYLELFINSITMALYVASALLLRRVKVKKQQDRKLLIFGVVVFAVNIPGLTLQALMGFSVIPRVHQPTIYYFLAVVADIKCFAAPITMLIVNDTFRREMLRRIPLCQISIRIGHYSTVSTVVSSTSNNNNNNATTNRNNNSNSTVLVLK